MHNFKPSKFKNIKVRACSVCWGVQGYCACDSDEIYFDSKKEWERGQQLILLERAGKISKLERQKRIMLMPGLCLVGDDPYFWGLSRFWTKLEAVKRNKPNVILHFQPPFTYKPDFTYIRNGEIIHEDVKPSLKFISPRFKKIQKLMKALGLNLEVCV